MGWLEGKVALVTGGASGIGRGVVETFVAEGAQVAVLDPAQQALEELSRSAGDATHAVAGDATVIADCARAVAEAITRFGRLDVLVCCPGVFDFFTSIVELPADGIDAAFDELFAINVKSYLVTTKAALPELLKSEGNIVFTLSNAAFLPGGGGPLYTASKFALRGLMVELAHELAPKIRVNGVAPGGTVTNLRGLEALGTAQQRVADAPDLADSIRNTTPLQVAPEPRDHAWAYVFLASKERTKGVTGTVIHSDGGLGSRGITKLAGLLAE